MAFMYKKNNQWRVKFLHTYSQGTSHIPTSRILHQMALMANQHENGEGVTQSPPLQTAVDTEQLRNIQESERYGTHLSGTKIT